MKYGTLFFFFLTFLFALLAEASMMSQIDYKNRQQIKETFANAHRVEVRSSNLEVNTNSHCDVQVESQALVNLSEEEGSLYDCLTCFMRVNHRVFQVNRPHSSCKMAQN